MLDTIDWQSSKTEVLYNPRMPLSDQNKMVQAYRQYDQFPGHIWLATSGSSGLLKWVVLSKEAILTSAQAVNTHLESESSDVWLNPLPFFHVGGVGIVARAALSGARVEPFLLDKWDPLVFWEQLSATKTTLTALVPTQLFDLVALNKSAPKALRAVVIGGGALSDQLYDSAVALGWRILPSYGMTECASQVATALLNEGKSRGVPSLVPLNHVIIDTDENGFLKIKSRSLLSAYVYAEAEGGRLVDPKVQGWFTTEDKAILKEGRLVSAGRGEHFIKIGGENVDLLRLEKILEEELLALHSTVDVALTSLPDERLGHIIVLAVAGNEDISGLVKRFHSRVFPFEKIRRVYRVREIPRSPLKKVLRKELLSLLSSDKECCCTT